MRVLRFYSYALTNGLDVILVMVSIISTIGFTIRKFVWFVNISAPMSKIKEIRIVLPILSPASYLMSGQRSIKTAPFRSWGFTERYSVGLYSSISKSFLKKLYV